MGLWSWICNLFGWWNSSQNETTKNPKNILILGLDNAGKTSLLHCLKTGEFSQFERTPTLNEDSFDILNFHVHAYDLGGHKEVIQLWDDYFLKIEAIVFVIDASDYSRINEAKEQLHNLINNETIQNIKFLILFNKSDIAGAFTLEELKIILEIPDGPRFLIDSISVKQLYVSISGFKWLLSDE